MCVSGVGSPATRRLECKVFSGCFLFSFLPPANEVCEGYDFTGICLSTGGGVSVHRGVSLFRGYLCLGVSVQGGVFVMETPHMVTCGWYTSYWNAFSFFKLEYISLFCWATDTPVLNFWWHLSWDSPPVWHLLTYWWPVWQQNYTFPHTCQ